MTAGLSLSDDVSFKQQVWDRCGAPAAVNNGMSACNSGQYSGDGAQHMATRGPRHPAVLSAGCVTVDCKVMRGIPL